VMVLLIFDVLNDSFSVFVVNGKHGISGLPGEIGKGFVLRFHPT